MFLKNHKANRHLKISLPDKKQNIFVGTNFSSWIIEKIVSSNYSSTVVFCDYNIANIYGDFLSKVKTKLNPAEIILVKPTEANKSIEFLNICLEKCIAAKLDRNGCLIAIGGGIVGDVAGFLASVYMRGIDMVFIPTTLMAQGDTIINKVAISYRFLKNIIGSFYSPCFTFCDTRFLRSLSEKRDKSGLERNYKTRSYCFTKACKEFIINALSRTPRLGKLRLG